MIYIFLKNDSEGRSRVKGSSTGLLSTGKICPNYLITMYCIYKRFDVFKQGPQRTTEAKLSKITKNSKPPHR